MFKDVLSRFGLGGEPSVWARGEREAERFLKRRGCRLLGRNVRTPVGEIDLLFEDSDRKTVIVVEVKSRMAHPGEERRPERSITQEKGRKLAALASGVSKLPRFKGRPVRIDVVAVEFAFSGKTEVRHYRNAIDAAGNRN